MKRVLILALAALLLIPFSTGCETVSRGINNVLGRPSETTTTVEPEFESAGNSGTTTTLPASEAEIEQAVSLELGNQVSAVMFSIKARIEANTAGRIAGLLGGLDRSESILKNHRSPRAVFLRQIIPEVRDAAKKRDLVRLQRARDALQDR